MASRINILKMQKGFIQFILLGIVVLILVGAGAFYLGKQTSSKPIQPQTSVAVSPAVLSPIPDPSLRLVTRNSQGQYVNKVYYQDIPAAMISSLPTKSPDGREITAFHGSPNSDYVIYTTIVAQRGAGTQGDWWIYRLSKEQSINISNLALTDPEIIRAVEQTMYTDLDLKNKNIFLVNTVYWVGDNPVFEMADGWSILADPNSSNSYQWQYQIEKGKFNLLPEDIKRD